MEEHKVKFSHLAHSLESPFKEHFVGHTICGGLMRGDPGGVIVTPEFSRRGEELLRFQPRSDDVWLCSFPKSGTNWTTSMLWLIANNCDFETAKNVTLRQRAPFLEMNYLVPLSLMPAELMEACCIERVTNLPSPRTIRTHLPFNLLPPSLLDTSKVIYVARNPKDVIVSSYYYFKLLKLYDFTGDFEQLVEYFMNDEILYAPYFSHVKDAWSKRNHPNMLFLFYEDMQKDLKEVVKKCCAHLGKSFTESQIDELLENLSFKEMAEEFKKNDERARAAGYFNEEGSFLRKGKTGDWKSHFSPELNERVDKWIAMNLEGSDLKFAEELK